MKKGLAFPTCISINNCVCHFSPLRSEPDVKLADGDVVKVDLGVHIDGFIAVGAHTHVVGASKDKKVRVCCFIEGSGLPLLLPRCLAPDTLGVRASYGDGIEGPARPWATLTPCAGHNSDLTCSIFR